MIYNIIYINILINMQYINSINEHLKKKRYAYNTLKFITGN